MKFLKGLALSLLGFLLFLSLSAFGLAFMLNNTLLSPRFFSSELDRLDVRAMVQEALDKQATMPPAVKAAIMDSLTKNEPALRQHMNAATGSIYDYLLGTTESLDLAQVLRNTVLSKDLAVSLVDNGDIAPFIREYFFKELVSQVPPDIKKYLVVYLENAIPRLKPWVREQVSIAADPVLDYAVGKSDGLNVVINLGPMKTILRDSIKQDFLKSPPPELAGVPPIMLEPFFDQLYPQFAQNIPAAIVLDEELIGTDVPADNAKSLAEAEAGLAQAKQYVGQFRSWYNLLIGFMLLLVLGIILIHREVRGATRQLGTTFVTYGAIEYAGIWVGKNLAQSLWPPGQVSAAFRAWLLQFTSSFLRPLEILSLVILIGGVVLLIVSFVYKARKASPAG
ncbi:MAG: hypothetical protein HY665_09505 [Chloroflexi bacterium]|nr:hypothetical protein [Chloroflexota bacterium]